MAKIENESTNQRLDLIAERLSEISQQLQEMWIGLPDALWNYEKVKKQREQQERLELLRIQREAMRETGPRYGIRQEAGDE